jgi:hypothetical protein
MDRGDFQTLADGRIADADALLKENRWPAAYYLLGYAIECALKACISKQFLAHHVPDKKIVLDFYTHDLQKLLAISNVKLLLEAQAVSDPLFKQNWTTVCSWNEAFRYDHAIAESVARDMYQAATDPTSGILPWLKTHW